MDVVNLDFAKAYNKVDHCTLIGKLKAMGVCGHLDQWLGSFLLERTQSYVQSHEFALRRHFSPRSIKPTYVYIYINLYTPTS